MKPYFSFGLYEGCNYVRLWLPMKYNGWVGDYKTLTEKRDPKEATKLMLQSDIVVMHRPFEDQRMEIAWTIKKMGKALVVDNDDTYKDPIGVKGQLRTYTETIDRRIESFIRNADLVTCSTEFLKQEYQRINKNVYVLPNCIDPDDWPEPQEYQNEKVRVGIVGSVAYDDFKICKEDLEKLSKEKDIQIVLFAFHSPDDEELKGWKNINYEFHPYVKITEYPKKLAELKLDMVIIPREDNYFNRCKSNIKFLEMSMLEIPVLAQGFYDGNSPYQQNKEDQKYMTIVYKDWYDAVIEAKNNLEKLKQKAKRARKYVLENYNIKTKYKLWKKIYKKIK